MHKEFKKVIDGKQYDTDTTEKVCSADNDSPREGFYYYEKEKLYRSIEGEFFLYGYGEYLSKYAQTSGTNILEDGEDIMELTEEDKKNTETYTAPTENI